LNEKEQNLLASDISTDILRKMYVTMVKIRKFEERVAELVAPPKEIITPCHLYIGEEAVATGVCTALKKRRLRFQHPSLSRSFYS
jgi:TPP-dependent pyruvate/acetoin dehydrogenase alpha subunit